MTNPELVDALYELNQKRKELEQQESQLKGLLISQMQQANLIAVPGKKYPITAKRLDRVITVIDPEVVKLLDWEKVKGCIQIKTAAFDRLVRYDPALNIYKTVEEIQQYIKLEDEK